MIGAVQNTAPDVYTLSWSFPHALPACSWRGSGGNPYAWQEWMPAAVYLHEGGGGNDEGVDSRLLHAGMTGGEEQE